MKSTNPPPPGTPVTGPLYSRRREAIEYWVKFWGSLVALISGTVAIVYGVGGWVLDRQSRSVALAEHRILESKIEQSRVDAKRETAEALEKLRRELLDAISLTREDQRETQRRIDGLIRASRALEARVTEGSPRQ